MNARMPYLKLLSASTMALLVTIVAGYLMSERASAQPGPPPNPVLAAIQEMQQTIVTLQNSVNALQASVDALGAPSQVNFRWTPVAFAAEDLVFCHVLNISDVQQAIRIELKNGQGANIIDATLPIAPGAENSVGLGQRGTGTFHCKFTVINGTRADIRGTIVGGGPDGRISFHIPAE